MSGFTTTFDQLEQILPPLIDEGQSFELLSHPGRGKSEFIEHTLIPMLSKRDGFQWGFACAMLATYTPPDLIGYQFKGERTIAGRTVTITDPSVPLWMFTREGKALWEYPRGILLLDEYGQSEGDVKRASADLLLNRRVGPWTMPDGWAVGAASNLMSSRSGVTKSFDFIINRRAEFHIQDDLQSLLKWMIRNGIGVEFSSFTEAYAEIVFTEGVPEKQGPWTTPRSLVKTARVLDRMRDDKGVIPVNNVSKRIAAGWLGVDHAAQLMTHIQLGTEMPAVEDIVKDPMNTRVPPKPDAQMLVVHRLAHEVNAKNAHPVIQYVERMPKDFAVSFCRAACRRDPKLVYAEAFDQWMDRNGSLMAAISDVR